MKQQGSPTSTSESRAPRRRSPPTYHPAQVRRVIRVTPHMLRITVAGEGLAGFEIDGAAGHIRVLLPAPGQDAPALPVWGPNGPVYPEGQPRPTSRAYTPRRWNAATRELDIEFFLHGEGPASSWAERAKPGDKLAVTGARGGHRPDPGAAWHLIAGDDTALPAIATVLEALPAGARADVYVEVMEAADEQTLESKAEIRVTWLHRGPDFSQAGRLLEAAVRAAKLPEGRGRVWVACEAAAMRRLRKHFLDDRGMERGALNTQGYWKYGEVNHPDHDRGEDVG